jgi:hypothetical protein
MLDRHIGRRDQHRLRMRQHVETVFPAILPHACRSDTAKGHGLHEQADGDLINRAAAEEYFADEAIWLRLKIKAASGRGAAEILPRPRRAFGRS